MIIGLTGGIASGKSTVAELFKAHGITVIDTDYIARTLVAPGRVALKKISQHFGARVLQADGSLDRAALRQIIFQHPAERQWLEKLLHPLIRKAAKKAVQQIDSVYGILMIPLLRDLSHYPEITRVLVVDAPEVLQLERLQARDKINKVQAKVILKAQPTRAERLSLADDVIHNKGNIAALKRRVGMLHKKYLEEGLC